MIGDQPAALLKWDDIDTVGVEKGKPLMLRFKMDQAKLFSVTFED